MLFSYPGMGAVPVRQQSACDGGVLWGFLSKNGATEEQGRGDYRIFCSLGNVLSPSVHVQTHGSHQRKRQNNWVMVQWLGTRLHSEERKRVCDLVVKNEAVFPQYTVCTTVCISNTIKHQRFVCAWMCVRECCCVHAGTVHMCIHEL